MCNLVYALNSRFVGRLEQKNILLIPGLWALFLLIEQSSPLEMLRLICIGRGWHGSVYRTVA